MAKASFKLTHNEPFEFIGDNGKYIIPPLDDLSYADWKGVAALAGGKADTKKILEEYKKFFLRICPELADEKIGDNQWIQFGTAYFAAMGES